MLDWIDEEEVDLKGIFLPINDVTLDTNGFLASISIFFVSKLSRVFNLIYFRVP